MPEARTAAEFFVPVPGSRLFVREVGNGPPLIVLHGGPDFNHRYLLPELDELAQNFRLIYYDQRGRGRSSLDVRPDDVKIESEVDDLECLRRHFGFVQIALLGHSWGGLLALEYATRHPVSTRCVILMNSAPVSYADRLASRSRRMAAESEALARMEQLASEPRYPEGDVAVEADYYRAHFAATLQDGKLLDDLVRRLRLDFRPTDILKARAIETRLYAQTWDSPQYDLLPALRACGVLARVIHGERDLFPLECARHIAEAVSTEVVLIRDSGHFSFLERPTTVSAAIAGLGIL
jgi:proline iminopeptidase